MAAPVIYTPSVGDPYPLLRDAGGGALVPAFATDPCDCCGGTVDLGCESCIDGIAALTCTVEISGVTATGSSICSIFSDCSPFNGSFILDVLTVSTSGLLPCDYLLEGLSLKYCERPLSGTTPCLPGAHLVSRLTSVALLVSATSLELRYGTETRCSDTGVAVTGGASAMKFFDNFPGGIDCIDGVYELPPLGTGTDGDCANASATATVTFNG